MFVQLFGVTIGPGSTCFYTTDGSDPTRDSTVANGGFSVSQSCTVKAKVFSDDPPYDELLAFSFGVTMQLAPPVITGVQNAPGEPIQVTITATEPAGVTAYYTTDESDPDPEDNTQLYVAPFELTNNATVKAIASHPQMGLSSIASQAFVIAGNKYYISPGGNDANDGKHPDRPKLKFNQFMAQNNRKLLPGDTLFLMDGPYEAGNTGLPVIRTSPTDGNANNGNAVDRITIQALNERKAILTGPGTLNAMRMEGVQYWDVVGLAGRNIDHYEKANGHAFTMQFCHNLRFRRCIAWMPNRYYNTHPYLYSDSSNGLFEECEAYFFNRHGFSIWKSKNVTLRRCYTNSRNMADIPPSQNGRLSHSTPGGDESYAICRSSYCIAENCISHNRSEGFCCHGGLVYDGSLGGCFNQILGCVSIDDLYGGIVDARRPDPKFLDDGPVYAAANNVYRNFVAIRPRSVGLYLRSATNALVENCSFFGAIRHGFASDLSTASPDLESGGVLDRFEVPGGVSFLARNCLAHENLGIGMNVSSEVHTSYAQEFCNSYTSVTNSTRRPWYPTNDPNRLACTTSIPSGMGIGQSVLSVPPGSNMYGAGLDGANIGADIIKRYEDGILTEADLRGEDGSFPRGAIVPGVNDVPGQSLYDVHDQF